jgi:hypothetical protein
MKKLTRVFLVGTTLTMVAPLAVQAASIRPKTLEADTRFTFQHTSVNVDLGATDDDYGVTVFDLSVGMGYFIDSRIEIAGDLLIDHTSVDDVSLTQFGLMGSGYYHFATSGNVIPFVGLGLGFVNYGGDGPDDTEFIIPEIVGGVRFPFEDVVSMNAVAGYRHRSTAFGIDDAGGHEFFLGFGFSVFLKGGVGE